MIDGRDHLLLIWCKVARCLLFHVFVFCSLPKKLMLSLCELKPMYHVAASIQSSSDQIELYKLLYVPIRTRSFTLNTIDTVDIPWDAGIVMSSW